MAKGRWGPREGGARGEQEQKRERKAQGPSSMRGHHPRDHHATRLQESPGTAHQGPHSQLPAGLLSHRCAGRPRCPCLPRVSSPSLLPLPPSGSQSWSAGRRLAHSPRCTQFRLPFLPPSSLFSSILRICEIPLRSDTPSSPPAFLPYHHCFAQFPHFTQVAQVWYFSF